MFQKPVIALIFILSVTAGIMAGESFERSFEDATLRIDTTPAMPKRRSLLSIASTVRAHGLGHRHDSSTGFPLVVTVSKHAIPKAAPSFSPGASTATSANTGRRPRQLPVR